MPRARFTLLALCAAVLAAAITAHGAPTGPAPPLFVRSCSDCADEGMYCEFAHPNATPEAPLACVRYADGHSLYRRYDYVGDCLSRPGMDTKYYQFFSYCYFFRPDGPSFLLHAGQGTCPVGSQADSSVDAPNGSAPGTCFVVSNIAGQYGADFGPDCNSVRQFESLTCSGEPTANAIITVPF